MKKIFYSSVNLAQKLAPLKGIPVLMYHSISDTPTPLSVSPERFESQLRALKKCNFQSLFPEDFFNLWQQKIFPKNNFLITFDDGFEDNLHQALPLLKKYQFTAIFFVSGNILGKKAASCSHDLDKQKIIMGVHELKSLVDQGFSIANHFYSHGPLIDMTAQEIELDYKKNTELLVHYLGQGFRHQFVAYPKNKTNQRVKKHLDNLGIKIAFSGQNRVARAKHHTLDIPRIQIFNTDTGSKFLAKLSPYYRL